MRVPFSLAGAVDLFFATSPSAHCFPPSKDHQLRTTSSSGPLPTTMSSPSSPTISWPDSMRLPAYRASYLGRYHPYPRTRTPAREVVMRVAESRPSEDNVAEENVDTGST
ncbi:hypothetical protein EDB89DRAFT_704311 [Lactarius sanguifluus]|nr:hypothetical protein EDB89DRAFT_704311 [Lactarius sanguifluus]